MRCGLRELIDKHRCRMIGEAIVQGYLKHPQTEEEFAWANDNAYVGQPTKYPAR